MRRSVKSLQEITRENEKPTHGDPSKKSKPSGAIHGWFILKSPIHGIRFDVRNPGRHWFQWPRLISLTLRIKCPLISWFCLLLLIPPVYQHFRIVPNNHLFDVYPIFRPTFLKKPQLPFLPFRTGIFLPAPSQARWRCFVALIPTRCDTRPCGASPSKVGF